jgi:hypothetical protein
MFFPSVNELGDDLIILDFRFWIIRPPQTLTSLRSPFLEFYFLIFIQQATFFSRFYFYLLKAELAKILNLPFLIFIQQSTFFSRFYFYLLKAELAKLLNLPFLIFIQQSTLALLDFV